MGVSFETDIVGFGLRMRCSAVLGVFTLALAGNVFGEISDCGEGWTMLELGHAGAVCVNVSPGWKSYQGARQYCQSKGARLFHPYSADEQKFLFDKMEVPKFYVGAMKQSDDGLVWSSLLASNQEVTKVEWNNLPAEDGKAVLKAKQTDDEKLELTCSAPSSWMGQVQFAFRRNNRLVQREKDDDGPVMVVEMEEKVSYSCVAVGGDVSVSNPVKVVNGAVEEMSDKEICAVAARNMLWQRIKCNSKGYLAKAVCTRKYDTPTDKTEEEAEKEEEAAENNTEEANAEGEKAPAAEEEAGKQEVKADDDEETDALRRTLLKAKLINMLKRELKNLSKTSNFYFCAILKKSLLNLFFELLPS